jgi:uncharacterized protein
MSHDHEFLKLNVGFIIHQTIGYVREFPFEKPTVHIDPDLDLENFNGTVRITRTAQGLFVQGNLQATIQTECVRCLTDFPQPLEIEFTELYAFSANSVTESGLFVPDSGKIDLAPIVREEMLVAIPISPICKEDCKGLCPICGENLNLTTCHHEEEDLDPRLEVLKKLIADEE